MSTKIEREYNAFGPWIIEFDEENLLPNLFIGFVDMNKKWDFLIKIPRIIERRVAKPGMNLYDFVIGIREGKMYVYERNNNEISQEIVILKDVFSIKIFDSLLLGELSLQLSDSIFKLEFNMVSEEIILKMVALIRKCYLTDQKIELNSFVNEKEIEKLEFYYNTKWEHLKNEEENIRIVGIQETKELSYNDQKIYKKLYYRITKKNLLSCLYVSNEKEFIVIKKGGEYSKSSKNDYVEILTFLPYFRIADVTFEKSKYTSEVKKMILNVANSKINFLFTKDNKYQKKIYNEFNL